jgi:co-chaperonin GroES (HSP10)
VSQVAERKISFRELVEAVISFVEGWVHGHLDACREIRAYASYNKFLHLAAEVVTVRNPPAKPSKGGKIGTEPAKQVDMFVQFTPDQLELAAKYTPLHDRLLIQVDPEIQAQEEKTAGGLILPAPQSGMVPASRDVRIATVLSVGEGEILYNGEIRKLAVQPRMRVLIHVNEVLPVEPSLDPTEPIIGFISERNVIAVVTKEEQPVEEDPNIIVNNAGEPIVDNHGNLLRAR